MPAVPNADLTVNVLALPPRGFDPVGNRTDRGRLSNFGLPDCPTNASRTIARNDWNALFAPGFQIVPPKPRPAIPVAPTAPVLAAPPSAGPRNSGPPGAAGLRLTSPNWSGGWIQARSDSRVFSVAGEWTVPDFSAGTSNPANSLAHRCSIWTGIDGTGRWNDSMPQVGTEHTVSGDPTVKTHIFWVQWWLGHGGTTVPIYIDGVTIAAGDVVRCGIVLDATGRIADFHMKNQTSGEMAALRIVSGRPAAGATAEWILERPGDTPNNWDKSSIDPDKACHPLPGFQSIGPSAFSVNGRADAGRDLTLVSMRECRFDPRRSVIIASAVRDAQGNMSVVYQGP